MKRLAIVGLGAWGRRLVESVQARSTSVCFTHAVVRRPEASASFAAANRLVLSDDLAAVLSDPSIEGVVSCGPAHLHASHSLAALQAGKPVLAIKPMALTGADAERLADTAAERGALLALGYNRCFFPNVLAMRQRLRDGAIGDVLHVEGNFCVDRYGKIPSGDWKADPAHAPAGSLADHMLYLTVETLGRIDEVHAHAYCGASDNALSDATAVLLRSARGRAALLTAIGVTADFYRFQVFGTEGWIELRDATHLTFQPRKGRREDVVFPEVDAERAELEAFAAAIGGTSAFPVSVEDAVHGVQVIEAMGRSAASQEPVRIA